MSGQFLDLDGSFGEGGGQILRTSLALSLLTGRPFRLRNIRKGRSRPGLQPQHLASVKAAAAIGGAKVEGAVKDSTKVVFEPGPITPGNYRFPIGTAGATGLLLHTVYLPLALGAGASSEVTTEGGTHVPASPCFHFLDVTWRGYLGLLGMELDLRMPRSGFYPRGGGQVTAEIKPCSHLRGLHLSERGRVTTATGFSAAAGLPEHIIHRQAHRAAERLEEAGLRVDLREEKWAGGPGTVVAIVLDTEPVPTMFFGLGARGKPAERVADEAVDQALDYLGAAPAAVDAHSADQLVLPLALAHEPSRFSVARVTQHLLTNIAVIGRFLDRPVLCEGTEGGPGFVWIDCG